MSRKNDSTQSKTWIVRKITSSVFVLDRLQGAARPVSDEKVFFRVFSESFASGMFGIHNNKHSSALVFEFDMTSW